MIIFLMVKFVSLPGRSHLKEEGGGGRGDGGADEQEREVDVDALGALLLLDVAVTAAPVAGRRRLQVHLFMAKYRGGRSQFRV